MSILPALHAVVAGQTLGETEAEETMGAILEGSSTPPQIAAFLTALRMKGEAASELTVFARAMRRLAQPFDTGLPAGEPLLDTCGTGGDGTVFSVTPAGVETILYSFTGGPADGKYPLSSLLQVSAGMFYGTTTQGGANSNGGTVFSITTGN